MSERTTAEPEASVRIPSKREASVQSDGDTQESKITESSSDGPASSADQDDEVDKLEDAGKLGSNRADTPAVSRKSTLKRSAEALEDDSSSHLPEAHEAPPAHQPPSKPGSTSSAAHSKLPEKPSAESEEEGTPKRKRFKPRAPPKKPVAAGPRPKPKPKP